MKSNTVIRIIGILGSSNICDFFLNNVLPHENYYLFYKKKAVCHFDNFLSNPHEGTNTGLNYS